MTRGFAAGTEQLEPGEKDAIGANAKNFGSHEIREKGVVPFIAGKFPRFYWSISNDYIDICFFDGWRGGLYWRICIRSWLCEVGSGDLQAGWFDAGEEVWYLGEQAPDHQCPGGFRVFQA